MNSACIVDGDDCLIEVNRDWDYFADSNGAPELFGEDILGRSMWDLIGDEQVRHFYSAIHLRVRETGEPLGFSYRCDAPETKRFMHMQVEPDPRPGHLSIRHTLVREEPLPAPLYFVEKQVQSMVQVLRCTACNSLNTGNGWQTVEEVIEGGLTADCEKPLQVVYRICEACQRRAMRLLERTG